MESEKPFEPCTFRQGRYKKIRDIGHGAYSHVMLVFDEVSGDQRVIKRVYDSDANACNEVEILKKIKDHPNIVKFYDSFTEREGSTNILHIVMEYCEGGDLAQFLKDRKKPSWIDNVTLERWCRQLLEAVDHLHELNILHRDLKTANVFVTKDNNLKVADFGISRSLSRTQCATTMVGTPYYMAPEVVNLNVQNGYNAKSDVWSVGVIAYELCSLDLPFPGANVLAVANGIMSNRPAALPDHIPHKIKELTSEMMQTAASKRPSIDEVLQRYISATSSPLTTSPVKAPRPVPTSPRILVRNKVRASYNNRNSSNVSAHHKPVEKKRRAGPGFNLSSSMNSSSASQRAPPSAVRSKSAGEDRQPKAQHLNALPSSKQAKGAHKEPSARVRSVTEKANEREAKGLSTADRNGKRIDRLNMLLKQEKEDEIRRLGHLAPTPRGARVISSADSTAAVASTATINTSAATSASTLLRSSSIKSNSSDEPTPDPAPQPQRVSSGPASPPAGASVVREEDILLLLRQGDALCPRLNRELATRALEDAKGDVPKAMNSLSQGHMRQKYRMQVKEKKVAWHRPEEYERDSGSPKGLMVRGVGVSPRPTSRAMLRSSTIETAKTQVSPAPVGRRVGKHSGVQQPPTTPSGHPIKREASQVGAGRQSGGNPAPVGLGNGAQGNHSPVSGAGVVTGAGIKRRPVVRERANTDVRKKAPVIGSPLNAQGALGAQGDKKKQPYVPNVEVRRKLAEHKKGITNARPKVDRRAVAEAWMQRQDTGGEKFTDGVVILPKHLRKGEEGECCEEILNSSDHGSSLNTSHASAGSPYGPPLAAPPVDDVRRLKEENEKLRKLLKLSNRDAAALIQQEMLN
eukprot:TRINITY_DN2038_c0_g1_i1.p1 TRINITY_DN2038_c0_g1~~TRINITY_DN2038_c0_g1_i1.p1  ORF type:complete len:889 (+),score=174.82 TRINITY_DN2038_c0_g1_i1:89-2668(+)